MYHETNHNFKHYGKELIQMRACIMFKVIGLSKRNICVMLNLVLIVVLCFQPTPVKAHTPESITLEYDYNSQVLVVQVVHSVTDLDTHYISWIEIFVSDAPVTSQLYSEQEFTTGMSDTSRPRTPFRILRHCCYHSLLHSCV